MTATWRLAAIAAALLFVAPSLARAQGPGASDGPGGATGVGAKGATVGSTGEVVIGDPSTEAAEISPYATEPVGQGATTEAARGRMVSGGSATESGVSAYGQTYPYEQKRAPDSTSPTSNNPYEQTFPYGGVETEPERK